jgi:hypothetical protein
VTDYAHNAVAREQRRAKAVALARTLYAELTPERRRAIASEAGVRPGSVETWALAASLLGERLAWDAHHPQAVGR